MGKEKKQKKCTCKVPVVRQVLPVGFKGTIICAGCQGRRTYPLEREVFKGKDPVEGFLFETSRHSTMTMERAALMMLLRIEKALVNINKSIEVVKKKKK